MITSISLYFFSTMGAATSYYQLLAFTLIFGIGTGLFGSPNISSIMGSVPSDRRGIASAFRAIIFNVGFTVSLNLAILLMTMVIPYDLLTQIMTEQMSGITEADTLLSP
jgi:hypothetical protein